MLQKFGDFYASIFLLLFSALMYSQTFNMKEMTVSRLGPQFAPRLVAIGIAILSIILLIQAIKKIKLYKQAEAELEPNESVSVIQEKVEEDDLFEVDEAPPTGLKMYLNVLATVGIIAAYVVLLPFLGFIITTTLYLFVQITLLAKKSQKEYVKFAIISIVSSVLIYFVFRNLLSLMLPAGILG